MKSCRIEILYYRKPLLWRHYFSIILFHFTNEIYDHNFLVTLYLNLATCPNFLFTFYSSPGKIPVWVSGSLIMNGPGGVDIYGEHSCKHLFDGPGLLQKFQVNNGGATYSSKFIESNTFTRNIAAQRLVLSEFGTVADPCQTIFAR